MSRSAAEMSRLADGSVVEDVITLLSSPKTNFLLSGNGYKVPISELQGKVVGLYFYTDQSSDLVFRDLKEMYEELRKRGENFEICVYLRTPQYEVNERPPQGDVYGKFQSDPYEGPELVIIRPRENIAHAYAMDIYREYGIEAYPFSKSRVTDIEVARLKSLTLDSVLFSDGDYNFVIDQDGQKIPASHLVGKNILLFLVTQSVKDSHRRRDELIYEKVIAWYNEIKHNDEAFEMIRVFYRYDHRLGETGESYNRKMPWLEFPYDKHKYALCEISEALEDLYQFLPMFVAFGRDGRFISMTSLRRLIDYGKVDDCPNFFDDVHLHGEVRDYIAWGNMWITENEETRECYIS